MIVVAGLLMVALLGAVLGSIRAQDEPWFPREESAASVTPRHEAVSTRPGPG
jgi:hypothetical protein